MHLHLKFSPSFLQFILPSAILYIPAFLSVLLPTYVRPVEQDDDDESISAPMAPLVNDRDRPGMGKSIDSYGTGSGMSIGGGGGGHNQAMYGKGGHSSYPTSRPI